MTIHELFIGEVEWTGYLLNIKSEVILDPDEELLVDNFIVLIAQDLNTGKKLNKLILRQIKEIDKDYKLRDYKRYWRLFLTEPKDYHKVLADYLIEKAGSDPV